MHRSPRSPLPSTSSAGSMKGQLSPETALATGTTPSPHQKSRRSARRAQPYTEIPQPTRTAQSTTHSTQTLPAKLSQGRATTTSRQTEETSKQDPIQPVVVPQPDVTQLPLIFSGNFDLYGMYLPSLARLCSPSEATTPDYSAVYDRILASQSKNDYTARCFLAPRDPFASTPSHGRFESASILGPTDERPLDIVLDSFTYLTTLMFAPTKWSSFHVARHNTPGPGLVGHARLSPTDGIKDAKGVFKIKRSWVKEEEGSVKELFQGSFSFGVCYDSIGKQAGHHDGSVHKFAFWGVRAMKDNAGKEIGLGPGDLM